MNATEMNDVTMAGTARLYVVVVDGNDDLGPFDAVYGYDPIVFTDVVQAEAKADELSESGDWPGGQPTYSVEETTLDELLATFDIALSRGIA